jgi:hypothetical protein
MDIDVTDVKSRELIKILNLYPQGHLEIKFERIFWSSDYSEPDLPREEKTMRAFDPRRPPQGQGDVGQRFGKMADVLGSMMGPPPRR